MRYTALITLATGIATAANLSTYGFQDAIVGPSRGGHAKCVSGSLLVKATSDRNVKFNFQIPQNQTGLTQTFVSLVSPGANFLRQIQGPNMTVSGTYNISGTLCQPDKIQHVTEVQFLTAGVGFDRYYWDFAPGYSYVDFAAENGYATFLYDRLGVGQSEKPDPLNVVQGPLEVEIAKSLAQQLRQGAFGGQPFQKVIGIGHSFGSVITHSVTARYPQTFDAAILTGFSTDTAGVPAFITGLNVAIASENDPRRFGGLSPGYFVGDTGISNQIAFFRFPGFDPAIAKAAARQKATATYGELFTQSMLIMPATEFAGPIAVVEGAEDLAFCFGNCTFPVNQADATLAALYPHNPRNGSYLAPNAGHGLNLHYSASGTYQYIQDFLKSNGL